MEDQHITRFWDKYIEKLGAYDVASGARVWHVRHAETYIKAHPDVRLADHSSQFVEKYLQDKGRQKWLKDRQFQQVVTALKVLFIDMIKAVQMNTQHPATHFPLPSNAMVLPLSGT